MGCFAAKFRGFWMVRGCGAAIQRTADMGGHSGRKNFLKIFKKGVKNPKNGVLEVPGGGPSAPYIGCAGWFLDLGTSPPAALLEVCFAQVP